MFSVTPYMGTDTEADRSTWVTDVQRHPLHGYRYQASSVNIGYRVERHPLNGYRYLPTSVNIGTDIEAVSLHWYRYPLTSVQIGYRYLGAA